MALSCKMAIDQAGQTSLALLGVGFGKESEKGRIWQKDFLMDRSL